MGTVQVFVLCVLFLKDNIHTLFSVPAYPNATCCLSVHNVHCLFVQEAHSYYGIDKVVYKQIYRQGCV